MGRRDVSTAVITKVARLTRRQHDGRAVTLSDSNGTAHCRDGFDAAQIEWIKSLKLDRRGRLSEAAEHFGNVDFHTAEKPGRVPCDVAVPCAIENEIGDEEADHRLGNECCAVVEGADIPVTSAANQRLRNAGLIFLPAKAANAGGVAVSGLEQSQNATRVSWSHEEVDRRLHEIMRTIHEDCVAHGGAGTVTDYFRGANVSAFERIAPAMLAYGIA